MTPTQLGLLCIMHNKANNPEGSSSTGRNSNTGNSNKHILDPDDPKTPVILAGLASMKLPAKR
jgi:hypothetical protein